MRSRAIGPILHYARGCLARECEPQLGTVADRCLVYAAIDHPAAASCVAMLQRYGLSADKALVFGADEAERRRAEPARANGREEARLFGDPADLSFSGPQEMQEVVDRLVRIPGIGVWTAEMFLIFHLGRRDVFSSGDLALRNGAMHSTLIFQPLQIDLQGMLRLR